MKTTTDTIRRRLFAAITQNDRAALASFLADGADPSVSNQYGLSPLMLACKLGHLECATALLDYGAKIMAVDQEKNSPLHFACMGWGNVNVIGLLLPQKVKVDATNSCGLTPLMLAANAGQADIVAALIEAGANVNAVSKHQETPLTFAAVYNHVEVAQLLLKAGANADWRDDEGWTPLRYAENEHSEEVVALLRK